MPYSPVDIPELRLEVLEKFIDKMPQPPELVVTQMFPSTKAESATIKWESVTGNRGLAPFIAPGSPSHVIAPSGIAKHSASAAFISEKIPFTEEWLNNMKKAGTLQQYEAAKAIMAREYSKLVNRNKRRKEWMMVKMLCEGAFDYSEESGTKLAVDYQIPDSHKVTLIGNDRWGESTADILGNIMDAKTTIKDATNGNIDFMMINTSVLKLLAKDPQITALLRKDAFGDGSLYGGNVDKLVGVNVNVLAGLLDIPSIIINDEAYDVRAYLTSPVIGGSTTVISVDNPVDYIVGANITLYNSTTGANEVATIASIQIEAGTITLSAAPTNSYRAGLDYVVMVRRFVPDNRAVFAVKSIEGVSIAEWKDAPFGIPRGYGLTPKAWMDTDPDVAWVRTQNKGLPILYHRDAIYQLQVR